MQPDALLPSSRRTSLEITLALALAATLAAVAALAVGRLARRLLTRVGRETALTEPLARGTLRVLRFMTFVVVFALLAFPALDLAGVEPRVGLHPREIWHAGPPKPASASPRSCCSRSSWSASCRRSSCGPSAIWRSAPGSTRSSGASARRRSPASSVARSPRSIWTTAVLIVLRELDVDITPVLTGAGIVGLAIGFGAQTLVRDVISGFFLIVEDQVRVGDVAMVNGTGGLVEQINLRTIVLRDFEGVVHVIPQRRDQDAGEPDQGLLGTT